MTRFLITCFFISTVAQAEVWKAQNLWAPAFENRYSIWVENSVRSDIFKSGPYAGIKVDCADLAYALRLIFAFENQLEFAIHDPTGSGIISQRMNRFDSIRNPASRFRAFLNYVLDLTGTHSLSRDTYPIRVSRESVRPGIVFLQKREESGHAEVVQHVSDVGAIYFWGSTVPPSSRNLLLSSSLTVAPVDSYSGFRAWIEPQDLRKPVSKIPFYGLDQFENRQNFESWKREITQRLAIRNETLEESRLRYASDLCALLKSRAELILEVYDYKNKVRRCLSRREKEMFSTPGRDIRIKKTLEQFLSLLIKDERLKPEMIDSLRQDLKVCESIQYFENESVDTVEFLKNLVSQKTSSDPNERVAERWGVQTPNGNPCR